MAILITINPQTEQRLRVRYFEVGGPMERDEAEVAAAKVKEWGVDTCCHCRGEYQYPTGAIRPRGDGQELCPDCADD